MAEEITNEVASQMAAQAKAHGVPSAVDMQDRVTIHFTMAHQTLHGDPTELKNTYHVWLETREQPWCRRVQVGPQRQALLADCWVKNPGMFALQNRTAFTKSVNPSKEEIDAVAKQVVEVWLPGAVLPLLVRPAAFVMLDLTDLTSIEICCQSGIAACTLTVFGK